jgi:opacity protein-like surface antigen
MLLSAQGSGQTIERGRQYAGCEVKRVIASVILALSTIAGAADSFYVSGLGGLSAPTDEKWHGPANVEVSSKDGYGFLGAVGHTFKPFRAEVEMGYLRSDLDRASIHYLPLGVKGDSKVTSYLLNGYYDFELNAPAIAYVTGGLGEAKVNILDADDDAFAWQLGAGVCYAFTDQLFLDFRYRYMATSSLDLGAYKADFATHIFMIGLRLCFF